jgi:hypothetical protein
VSALTPVTEQPVAKATRSYPTIIFVVIELGIGLIAALTDAGPQ